MYSKYLYYKIENGYPHDDKVWYKGGEEGLSDAENRLKVIKRTKPMAYIKSYFYTTKII